ncbi:MAG: YceI family protein [Pseudonocardiaceae bacterium]
MGHDVDLRVRSLSLQVGEDDAITAEFDADSLEVVSEGPSDSDRKKIAGNAADTLGARKYSKITFRSTSVERTGDSANIQGDLTLHGVTKPISVQAHDDGKSWNADITLDQTDYGIKPFTAMLGALKVKAEVKIHISVPNA